MKIQGQIRNAVIATGKLEKYQSFTGKQRNEFGSQEG